MKNFTLLLIAIVLISCGKEGIDTDRVNINSRIKSTESLEVELGGIPTEGGVRITRQAENFLISEIDSREEGLFYIYQPEEGFTGTDHVEITRDNSNGFEIYSRTLTILTIEVSE